jgi:hypothetical protein
MGNMRPALRPLQLVIWKELPFRGDYNCVCSHTNARSAWREMHRRGLVLPLRSLCGKQHKEPLHGIVTSSGLNELSLCVSYFKEEEEKGMKVEIHSSPSEE